MKVLIGNKKNMFLFVWAIFILKLNFYLEKIVHKFIE